MYMEQYACMLPKLYRCEHNLLPIFDCWFGISSLNCQQLFCQRTKNKWPVSPLNFQFSLLGFETLVPNIVIDLDRGGSVLNPRTDNYICARIFKSSKVEHPNLILKLVAEAVLRTCIGLLVIINLG